MALTNPPPPRIGQIEHASSRFGQFELFYAPPPRNWPNRARKCSFWPIQAFLSYPHLEIDQNECTSTRFGQIELHHLILNAWSHFICILFTFFKQILQTINIICVRSGVGPGPDLDRTDRTRSSLGPGPGPPAGWTGPEGQGQVHSKYPRTRTGPDPGQSRQASRQVGLGPQSHPQRHSEYG